MKIELDGQGFRVVVVWASLKAVLKALFPLVTAVLALVSAPEITKLGSLLGLW